MKKLIDYQSQLSSSLENEINNTELKKSDINKLQKQYSNLLNQATQVCSSIGASLSIINAANYGGQLSTLAKKLNKRVQKINPLIEAMISSTEAYILLYQGRTKLYYQASELFQTLNKSYNINFNANIKAKDRLRVSYNPLLDPTTPKQVIGSTYYLFIQRMGQAIDPNKLKNYQDNPVFKKIKMSNLTKANKAKFKTDALLDLNGKALEEKYNYRAYLLIKINPKNKKRVAQDETHLSIGSYPFSINNKTSDYSLKPFYQEFKAYKSQEEYVIQLYQTLNTLVMQEKASNPLISDELVDTMTTTGKELEQLHKIGLKGFEQLLGLAK